MPQKKNAAHFFFKRENHEVASWRFLFWKLDETGWSFKVTMFTCFKGYIFSARVIQIVVFHLQCHHNFRGYLLLWPFIYFWIFNINCSRHKQHNIISPKQASQGRLAKPILKKPFLIQKAIQPWVFFADCVVIPQLHGDWKFQGVTGQPLGCHTYGGRNQIEKCKWDTTSFCKWLGFRRNPN